MRSAFPKYTEEKEWEGEMKDDTTEESSECDLLHICSSSPPLGECNPICFSIDLFHDCMDRLRGLSHVRPPLAQSLLRPQSMRGGSGRL